jgi:hypothetical protein
MIYTKRELRIGSTTTGTVSRDERSAMKNTENVDMTRHGTRRMRKA